MLRGELYGPADFYAAYVPWRAASAGPRRRRRRRRRRTRSSPTSRSRTFPGGPPSAKRSSTGGFPFWNRFVLAGNPLLAAAQAGIFHPSTWAGIFLPLPLSWTFSCAFTLFLGLLAAYLFFRDLAVSEPRRPDRRRGVGASRRTSSSGTAGASALRPRRSRSCCSDCAGSRAAAPRGRALTVAALLLSLAGGHPESFFHATAAAGVYLPRRSSSPCGGRARCGPLRQALGAGALAFLLAAPQLFPLLEAIPHSAEYRDAPRAGRRGRGAPVRRGARVAAGDSCPALLPFAHGIYGKSPVQAERADGSGMPLAYAGAVLFPLAVLGLSAPPASGPGLLRRVRRGAGLLLGASAPG